MRASRTKTRIRPLLLGLLWTWAVLIAIVLDLFWNITEFDSIRPRSSLYRGMRRVAHELVGERLTPEVPLRIGRRFSPNATSRYGQLDVVVREADGTRVPDARVKVAANGWNHAGTPAESVSQSTDQRGRAALAIPPAWATHTLLASASSSCGTKATRAAARCRLGDAIELWIGPAAVVDGRVVSCAEHGLRGAVVLARCAAWAETNGHRSIPVSDDGTFRVAGVTARLSLIAVSPKCACSPQWQGTPSPASATEVRLALRSRAVPSVTIRVRDTSGHPLPKGTVVTVRAGPAGRAPWIPHLLGADSTLLLRRWSDTVAINIPPTRGVDAAWATVGEVLDLGTPRGDAGELQVWEAINATFVLVDANGRPLIGAPVWIRRVPSPARHAPNVDIQARTDDAGRIQPFQDVARPLGDYEIRTHDRHVLWKGNISSDADREIRVAVDSKFVPVRATLSDHSGRMVSSRYVSAAVARPRERLRRPGPDFREGPVLTFIVERSRLADSVVRVEHKWQGVEDHAIGPSGEVNVRLSAEAGVVGIRLHGEQTPTRGLVVLALEQSATVRYEIPLPDRGKGIVFGVRPGQYSWRTLHTDLLSERSGGDLTVVPGKETDLLIR